MSSRRGVLCASVHASSREPVCLTLAARPAQDARDKGVPVKLLKPSAKTPAPVTEAFQAQQSCWV